MFLVWGYYESCCYKTFSYTSLGMCMYTLNMLLLGVYLGLKLYVFSFSRYCLFSKVVVVV